MEDVCCAKPLKKDIAFRKSYIFAVNKARSARSFKSLLTHKLSTGMQGSEIKNT